MTAPTNARLGRNEPCHCGSGRKYKHCLEGRRLTAPSGQRRSGSRCPIVGDSLPSSRPPKHRRTSPGGDDDCGTSRARGRHPKSAAAIRTIRQIARANPPTPRCFLTNCSVLVSKPISSWIPVPEVLDATLRPRNRRMCARRVVAHSRTNPVNLAATEHRGRPPHRAACASGRAAKMVGYFEHLGRPEATTSPSLDSAQLDDVLKSMTVLDPQRAHHGLYNSEAPVAPRIGRSGRHNGRLSTSPLLGLRGARPKSTGGLTVLAVPWR